MTPYYADEWLTVLEGDCREVMAGMEPESVHCVVTSPPYWGLRDYGTPGQLGLEPTPEEYVAALVDVFRAVRRVLRADGTVWLVLGDSYANPGNKRNGEGEPRAKANLNWGRFKDGYDPLLQQNLASQRRVVGEFSGLKPKDLVGIPWRVAFALQADGWYLRKRIVWCKPNPMPESVRDRPTSATEDVFLLAKSPRYFYDADAVRETATATEHNGRYGPSAVIKANASRGDLGAGRFVAGPAGRNLRDWWVIPTAPYPGSHFATFPPRLVEPCIKAGTSERGVCPECGAPWERVVERDKHPDRDMEAQRAHAALTTGRTDGRVPGPSGMVDITRTAGWRSTCAHAAEPVAAVVLDPFAGTGTVGLVAAALSRCAVLIDLNAEYLEQCLRRNRQTPLGLPA